MSTSKTLWNYNPKESHEFKYSYKKKLDTFKDTTISKPSYTKLHKTIQSYTIHDLNIDPRHKSMLQRKVSLKAHTSSSLGPNWKLYNENKIIHKRVKWAYFTTNEDKQTLENKYKCLVLSFPNTLLRPPKSVTEFSLPKRFGNC